MATTYEITVSAEDGSYPKVIGMRRIGRLRALWLYLSNWLRRNPGSSASGNRYIADLDTVDIVMDIPCEQLKKQILHELTGITDPNTARLVVCLPTSRKKKAKAVEV